MNIESIEEIKTEKMGRLFIKYAFPGMIGMLGNALYNLMDGIFVGRLLGGDELAAVSIVFIIVMFNQSFFSLIGTGSVSILSRGIGSKNDKIISHIPGNLILMILIPSAFLSVVCFFFSENIVSFFGASENIAVQAERYLKVLSIGFVFGSIGPGMNILLRGEGKMKLAMLVIILSTSLNIILDPIMIKIFGIEGAAIATIISQIFYLILTLVLSNRKSVFVKFRTNGIHFRKEFFKDILSIGFSAMMIHLMTVIQQLIFYKSLAYYGSDAEIILMGATLRILSFVFIPLWGISQGLQPIIGINYGSMKIKRVQNAYKTFLLISSSISGILWIFVMVFPQICLGMFITDNEIVHEGMNLFRIALSSYFLMGFLITTLTLYQAIGKALKASILTLGRQLIFFIPLVLILPLFFGIIGVWLSIPLTDFLTSIFTFLTSLKEKEELNGKKVINVAGKA